MQPSSGSIARAGSIAQTTYSQADQNRRVLGSESGIALTYSQVQQQPVTQRTASVAADYFIIPPVVRTGSSYKRPSEWKD